MILQSCAIGLVGTFTIGPDHPKAHFDVMKNCESFPLANYYNRRQYWSALASRGNYLTQSPYLAAAILTASPSQCF